MEKTFDHSPAMKNQDESLNLNSGVYGTAVVSSIVNEALELNNEERHKENLIVGDTEVSEKFELPVNSKKSTEKVSPTLLESALKVMKTFFSPEKAKNASSNSVNPDKDVSENSHTSVHFQNKQKPITSEQEIEIPVMKSPFSEGHDLKDKKQLLIPILSPFTVDPQSNDDDSFLTTQSYDESFQSAVTHLDENGELMKNCDNLSNSIFSSSQDFHLAESCNSSLENSECCLENTMLKNDSRSLGEMNLVKNINGNNEEFKGDHNEVPNADCPCQASAVESEVFKADHLNSSTETSNKLTKEVSDISGGFPALNGISSELEFNKSGVNTARMVLNNENQILDQNAGPGYQQLVSATLQSMQCPSNNSELENIIQEKKILGTENLEYDLVEKKKIEIDDELAFAAEKAILENGPGSSTVYLTKSDFNEVDEMLLALKKGVGTSSSSNSFNRGDVIFTNPESACFLKSSDFVCTDQKLMETQESIKPEISVSPNDRTSDKSKGILQEISLDNCSGDRYVPNEAQSLLREKEKLMEFQNELRMGDTFNVNKNHEKVELKDEKELTFEKGYKDRGSMPQKSNATLPVTNKIKRPVIHPSLCASANNSFDASPLCATCTEILENDESESTKLFLGETVCNPSLKHSTPVSVSRSCDSVCSSAQKLEMHSLEINEENGDDKENVYKINSDFLGRAMGIFWGKESSNLFAENPNEKGSNPLILAESTGSSIWIKSSNPPNEFSETSLMKHELNKQATTVQNLRSTPSSRQNVVYETKPKSFGQEEFFEERLEPRELAQTFDKKSKSSDSLKLDLSETVEVQEPVKLSQNKTYDKVIDDQTDNLSLTFCKKIDSIESENNQPQTFNEPNGTEVKETVRQILMKNSGCDVKDLNKISEKGLNVGFLSDKERSGHSESQEADNFLSPIKELFESMSQTSYISENGSLNIDGIYSKDESNSFLNGSFSPSPSDKSSTVKNVVVVSNNQVMEGVRENSEEVSSEVRKESPNEGTVLSRSVKANVGNREVVLPPEVGTYENIEPDLALLIEQQFTPTDIVKICKVAGISERLNGPGLKPNENKTEIKVENVLSPKSFDFLSSIQGKPTGRDLSRESLYVKFDPLVQPPTANSLIDFTKEVQALDVSGTPPADHSSSICEELLAITPEKKTDVIVPPLTPLSDRNKKDEIERQRELQNEIYFLKNLYSERERINKNKMEEYENQIAKLTGDKCVLEDKLKEYGEREKSLVKKMTEQNHDIEHLKMVMKEYVKVISVLTTELETMRKENAKQIETLTAEKDSYMNHLQNTEAAFSDVHTKYEKSKRTIESLKMNEVMYRNTISEHAQKLEEYKKRGKEAQEKAVGEFQNIMLALNESKNSHSQEVSRLRAQLKKTELKLEAVQESLDQKIKENQQLTAICDELIEGKK